MEGTIQEHKQHIFNFLKQQKSGVLSTVRQNGYPDAAFIYYFLDEDRTIYFITRRASRKTLNIDHQSNVVLTVAHELTKEVAQVRGIAEILPTDHQHLTERLLQLAKLVQGEEEVETVLPLLKHTEEGSVVVVRIQPTELRWRRYSALGLEQEKISV